MSPGVRPTRRVLDELGLRFPLLVHALEAIADPLVAKAQSLPDEVGAGGAERIRSLTDRVWFKVKTSDHRGAAGLVVTPFSYGLPAHGWWLAAAGQRQADTPTRDFYDRLEAECSRAGRGSGGTDSSVLEPVDVDYRRWLAELAARAEEHLRRTMLPPEVLATLLDELDGSAG